MTSTQTSWHAHVCMYMYTHDIHKKKSRFPKKVKIIAVHSEVYTFLRPCSYCIVGFGSFQSTRLDCFLWRLTATEDRNNGTCVLWSIFRTVAP